MFCASWWRRYRPPCVPTEEYIRAAAAMAERYSARRSRHSPVPCASAVRAWALNHFTFWWAWRRSAPPRFTPPLSRPTAAGAAGRLPGAPLTPPRSVFVSSVFVASDDAGAVTALRAALPHLAIAALDLDRSVFESNWCPATAALTGARHARGAGAQPLYILPARDSTPPWWSKDPFLHTL